MQARHRAKIFVVVSYDLMSKPKMRELCHDDKWFKMVICDESHMLKSRQVRIFSYCRLMRSLQHADKVDALAQHFGCKNDFSALPADCCESSLTVELRCTEGPGCTA